MRCYCKQKEQRRQRMFEKALDAAATSPFARGVTRWLLAGALKATVHVHCALLKSHTTSCSLTCAMPCTRQEIIIQFPSRCLPAQATPLNQPTLIGAYTVLAGMGNGSRIAAVVGTKCRGTIAGFALLSYPLEVGRASCTC